MAMAGFGGTAGNATKCMFRRLSAATMSNSKRRCLHCRNYFPKAEMHDAPVGFFCTYEHLLAYAERKGVKSVYKQRKEAARAFKAETRAMRAKLNENNHKWQTAATQRVFNELVRLLDVDRSCIVHGYYSCGQKSGWSAGHYLTVASHPQLRFDLRNCFRQCLSSNKGDAKWLANNASIRTQFERGIEVLHGADLLAWLKGHHPAKHYTCAELADMRAAFRAEIRRIKRGEKPSKNWRALERESAAA